MSLLLPSHGPGSTPDGEYAYPRRTGALTGARQILAAMLAIATSSDLATEPTQVAGLPRANPRNATRKPWSRTASGLTKKRRGLYAPHYALGPPRASPAPTKRPRPPRPPTHSQPPLA